MASPESNDGYFVPSGISGDLSTYRPDTEATEERTSAVELQTMQRIMIADKIVSGTASAHEIKWYQRSLLSEVATGYN